MKAIKKQKKLPGKIILAASIAAVVLLMLGIGAYYYLHQRIVRSTTTTVPAHTTSSQQNTVNYGPPTDQQKQESTDQKQKAVDENTPSQSTPPTDTSIHVSISRDGQTGAGQPLNVRTLITGISNGTCTITLTKDGQPTIIKTFTVVYQATSATCQNADIPISSFSTSGAWSLSVVAQNGSAVSPAATDTVNIEK